MHMKTYTARLLGVRFEVCWRWESLNVDVGDFIRGVSVRRIGALHDTTLQQHPDREVKTHQEQ